MWDYIHIQLYFGHTRKTSLRDWIEMLKISSTQRKHSNALGSFQFITLIGPREERPAGSECR